MDTRRFRFESLLCLAAMLAASPGAQAQTWKKQAPMPTGADLHAVHMLTATELWAAGGEGVLAHSLDAGQSWQTTTIPTNSLWALEFTDAQHGWAAGNGFFHTVDGGAHWIQDNAWGSIYDLHFVDTLRGWACGNGGVTYRTTDGGLNWSYAMVGPITTLSSIMFIDALNGWTVNIDGEIYASQDGGQSWLPRWSAGEYLSTVQFFDAQEGWAIGGDTFLHTLDGGQSWTPAPVPAGTWSHAARFFDRAHGIAVGEYGNIVISADGGQSWTPIAPIGSGPRLWDVESASATTSAYCGETGGLALSTDGGAQWTSLQSGGAGVSYAIDAVDSMHAWTANDGGEILRTENGGAHWQRIAVQGFDNYGRLQDIDFVDASLGWAVGRHEFFGGGTGHIVRSSDGGVNWSVQHSLPGAYFESVEALDALSVLALGQYPLGARFILRSIDGGQSWNDVSPSLAVFMDSDFVDPLNGWVVGGRIYRSSDGGQSWVQQHTPSQLLYAVSFADISNGWAVGWGPTLLHTSDGGQTWTPQDAGMPTNVFLEVQALSPTTAWISGGDAFVARTSDGGQTWQPESLPDPDTGAFGGIFFLDADHGWVSGPGVWRRGGTGALPIVYCSAKPNSLGCTPAIGWTGIQSASSLSGFTLSASNVRNNKSGLLFYGVNGRSTLPFQGGTLCVKTPLKRTAAVQSGGTPPPANDCSGLFAIDMNAFAHSPGPPVPLPELTVPGSLIDCQWWGRDPGFPPPNNTTLSDGLEYTVEP